MPEREYPSIFELVQRIRREHEGAPPATEAELREAEARLGFPLAPELREFYLTCNGATLFFYDDPRHGRLTWGYRVLPLAEIVRVRLVIFGEDYDEGHPDNWYAICDVMDGNYVAIDVNPASGDVRCFRDCYGEHTPDESECRVVAWSLREFLDRAMGGTELPYWLEDGWDWRGCRHSPAVKSMGYRFRVWNRLSRFASWLARPSAAIFVNSSLCIGLSVTTMRTHCPDGKNSTTIVL